jgi:hypothetical protein
MVIESTTGICTHLMTQGVDTQVVIGVAVDGQPTYMCNKCAVEFAVQALLSGTNYRVMLSALNFDCCGHGGKCRLCYMAFVSHLQALVADMKLAGNATYVPLRNLAKSIYDRRRAPKKKEKRETTCSN